MEMTAYLMQVLVTDFEDVGKEEVIGLLESNRYIGVRALEAKEKKIPEWGDDHILNQCDTTKEQIQAFFAEA